MKYSKELIDKAKKMYKQKYQIVAIAKYLNIPYVVVRYHCLPGQMEKSRANAEAWRQRNLGKVKKYMKGYKTLNIKKVEEDKEKAIKRTLDSLIQKVEKEKTPITRKRVIEIINNL